MTDCVFPGASLRARLLDTALAAARRGWPVLPLLPGTELPATGAGVDGKTPWEAATTDPARVRSLWSSDAFNIGMAPGPARLLVVGLDDQEAGGETSLRELCERHGEPVPETRTVRMWDGSAHLYFTSPAALRFPSTSGRLAPGVSTHGWGTYVVASGSVVGGRRVETPGPALINPLPGWLRTVLRDLR
ncbi:bifunctional DNA primase/polymerase [Streptomyces sp. NPDC087294]|uniref:bifunctional DNA primase/polymerase n=1 Tax=Streptomyces sp. NPDC087294 TaxID=3365777 RepID=UPI0038154174